MRCTATSLITFTLGSLLFAGQSFSQTAEEARLASAGAVLNAFTSDPETAIPPLLLEQAEGLAIIPSVVRAGFIFGGRRGKGVVLIRTENGEWSNPSFITLTGGSFGAQIGMESVDVILVFGAERSVRDIAEGKFTVGGDASATAGPVGRNSTATRDMTFTAELYTYVRSRGLFAGATIEGAKLAMDDDANRSLYPQGGEAQPLAATSFATSSSARRLLATLADAEAPSSGAPAAIEEEEAPREAVLYPLGARVN